MNYLKSEHLKFRKTILNKLLFIIPLITSIFAWLIGGFTGFQYTTLYWWYAFLLPGTIAVLCSLSHRKEENAGRYYSVFSMPISLSKFEAAKGIVLTGKLLFAAMILAMIISVSNIISPATAVYSVAQSIIGSIGIILASIWQIPLCLFLVRKVNLFLPIVINTVLGIFIPAVVGRTAIWWLMPYCYAAKLAEPLLGIALNGTFAGGFRFSAAAAFSILLSLSLFFLFTYVDAKNFAKER